MATIQTLEALRDQVKQMHQNKQVIHVSISNSHPKVTLVDVPVHIQYASSQVFWIEREDRKQLFCNSFQYADLLTRRIEIKELDLHF